ncbi:MAG: radical SAM protein [candidate division NC10 bacterium]|nr:radical SAM protein [candidate division NC10 bacterium]
MSWKLREKAKKLLAAEEGTIFKSPGGKASVALIYPNTYHVGMSNLGFLAIYHYLNAHPAILCERAFLPDPQDLPEFERTKTPLFSLESGRPLSSFDILAFSVSYENDYLHLLKILELTRVPLLAEERGPKHPLVVMGGICASSNPEPLASFIDLFFLGEGEDLFPRLVERFQASEGRAGGKEAFLQEAVKREGVYVPRFYRFSYGKSGGIEGYTVEGPAPLRPRRHALFDLDPYPVLNFVRTPNTEFQEMRLIEISRGCKRGCSFCLVGGVCRPFRHRSKGSLLESLRGSSRLQNKERVGLIGPCISDHPQIEELCEDLLGEGYSISASSLRAESIPEGLLASLAKSGQKTITLAPEAASERLRSLIGKRLGEEEFYVTVERILGHRIPHIKLYFMIGLPTEGDEEVQWIAEMAKRVKHLMLAATKDSRRLGQVTLSINAFVPKPWTPFQWVGFEEVGRLQQKLAKIKKVLRGASNIVLLHDLPQWAYIQALLARGDRRLGELLLSVHRLGGGWRRALREWSLNPDFFVTRPRSPEELFPWDHLEAGPSKQALRKELERAGIS